jgi:hypothetical protein
MESVTENERVALVVLLWEGLPLPLLDAATRCAEESASSSTPGSRRPEAEAAVDSPTLPRSRGSAAAGRPPQPAAPHPRHARGGAEHSAASVTRKYARCRGRMGKESWENELIG